MREHRQIVERWRNGLGSILVTLVRVQGSSYRRPGARLMIDKDGTYEGGISAGCLESDLLRKAAWLIRDGAAMERYSTLFDETAEIPFGLGCGGVLDVLMEPIETPECQALLGAIESALRGDHSLVATWLPTADRRLVRAIFSADRRLLFASDELSQELLSQARTKLFLHTDLEVDDLFVERLAPPQRLFVFGAGDDAKPLVTMAGLLGWSVTVVDGRRHMARGARFPESNVTVSSVPEEAMAQIRPEDAAVIMTHSYEQDKEFLTALLPLRPRYLGLLGARHRSALLIAEAANGLGWSISECCDQICAPIGLDIGGEGPDAIALAILAEAQATCMGKQNESRKLSLESVEHYVASADAEAYVQTRCSIGTV